MMAYQDRTHAALLRDIDHYRVKTFERYNKEVRIYPSKTANEVENLVSQQWVGFSHYDFDQYGKPAKTMQVAFRIRHGRDEVKIRYRGLWTSVLTYMRDVSPSSAYYGPSDGTLADWQRLQSAKQAEWWNKNGKLFCLLDLPGEIRSNIFEFALAAPIEPYPTTKGRNAGQLGVLKMRTRQPQVSILLANKQIYEEASNVFYLCTPVILEYRGLLTRVMQNERLWPNIRLLELSLDHTGFFELFGLRANGQELVKARSHPETLRMLKLSRLTLWFQEPAKTGKLDFLDGACHKTIVDWIFEAAWPHIKGHPLFFKGYVKNSQKTRFDAQAVVERTKFKNWNDRRHAVGTHVGSLCEYDEDAEACDTEEGGIRLDGKVIETWWEEDVELAKDDSKELPPSCICQRPCDGEWTAED